MLHASASGDAQVVLEQLQLRNGVLEKPLVGASAGSS